MKKKKYYLCQCLCASTMGSNRHSVIVAESQLKDFDLYAEYVDVYELVSNKPLSKTAKKKLGMEFGD